VINARFIKPIDEDMLLGLLGVDMPILTIEEAVLQGGFGSSILEFASEKGYHHAEIDRIGIPDRFIEHGSVNELLNEIGLTTENVVNKLQTLARKKQKRA
jgi:1-deoxy-D-xylulose-5-phosphate synthase